MKKIWMAILVNLVLLAAVGVLAWQLNSSVKQFPIDHNPVKIRPEQNLKQSSAQEKTLPPPAEEKTYYFSDFKIIPEKTIFSESRSIAPPTPPESRVEVVQPLAQKPILVGITIAGNLSRALIIDPTAPAQNVAVNPTAPSPAPTAAASAMIAGSGTPTRMPNRSNQIVQVKRIGDVYQGYTLTSITPEGIVLERGNRREVIPLHEGSKRAQGGKTTNLATRVVSIGGSGSTGSGASNAPGTGGGGGRGNQASAANPAAGGGAGGGRGGGRGSGGGTGTQPATGIMQILGLTDLGSSGQSQDVIRTLFGGTAGTSTVSPDGSISTPFGSVLSPGPMPGN
jgi:hypothetical protein